MKSAIDEIFSNRNEFLIVGLTGMIGSGCTTTANLLSTDISNFPAPPISSITNPDEARVYKIIHKYFIHNWKPLKKIRMTDVIATFIFEEEPQGLLNTIRQMQSDGLELPEISKFEGIIDTLEFLEKRDETTEAMKILNDGGDHKYVLKYFDDMYILADSLRKKFNELSPTCYTTLFQQFGDKIRKNGKITADQTNNGKLHIYSLADRVNSIIKCYRKMDINRFVIDAFRNPFEAMFFQERYTAFYLLGINCNESDRLSRNQNRDLTVTEIVRNDKKESPKNSIDDLESLISQNVPDCIQRCDIHISNNGATSSNDRNYLIRQLMRYISLILHPGLVNPTFDERNMQIARCVKSNSGCISRQVGAVIVDQTGNIIGVGCNDVPNGQVSCIYRSVDDLRKNIDNDAYSEYERTNHKIRQNILTTKENPSLAGRNLTYCFKKHQNDLEDEKNQVHTRSLHAEEVAFLQIVQTGARGIKGSTLYTTASPCELCSKKAYHLGISKIIFIDPYPGIANNHVISCGSSKPVLQSFSGAIGRSYHKLYEPFLSYKDEIQAILGTPPDSDAILKKYNLESINSKDMAISELFSLLKYLDRDELRKKCIESILEIDPGCERAKILHAKYSQQSITTK